QSRHGRPDRTRDTRATKITAPIEQFFFGTYPRTIWSAVDEFLRRPRPQTGRVDQLWYDKKPLSYDIPIPSTYQTYLDLGRFRNALILDEAKHHPSAGLTNFISVYRLAAYEPVVKMPDRATALQLLH